MAERLQLKKWKLGKLKEDKMEVEMEVDAGVPQAESAEINSPKRTVIRVESELTQECVCEMLTMSPEEAEELAFVPSALREPPAAIYFCDGRCSGKSVRCWQFASVVVEEGGEARTVNLCQQCFHERRVQQGEPRLNSWQWRADVEKKAHRGRIWDDAARERQEGIQGHRAGRSWSRPEEMKIWDAAKKSFGKDISQQGTADGKNLREECRVKGKSREGGKRRCWSFGYCTGTLEKKYGFLEVKHCARRWKERSYLVAHLPFFLWRTMFGGYRRRRSTAFGGVRCVEENLKGEHPTGFG